jgi:hypothetical protein
MNFLSIVLTPWCSLIPGSACDTLADVTLRSADYSGAYSQLRDRRLHVTPILLSVSRGNSGVPLVPPFEAGLEIFAAPVLRRAE